MQTSGKQNKQGSTDKRECPSLKDKGLSGVLDQLNLEGLDNWTEDQQRALGARSRNY